ncbi:hypothetical protein FRC09_013893 [Ceratobasidium sp. 395]|nr:hypothetical protein FRC09_013893 [Ceratobasidium sp. 395]
MSLDTDSEAEVDALIQTEEDERSDVGSFEIISSFVRPDRWSPIEDPASEGAYSDDSESVSSYDSISEIDLTGLTSSESDDDEGKHQPVHSWEPYV